MLLIVGLDGASYDLCERWIRQGHLPNLARIKDEGILRPLKSTTPSVSPVAWSSFMTGTNPGEHGVFGFFVPERVGPYEPPTCFRPVSSRDCHGERFWEKMNEGGLSTGIVGVPVTYPVQAVEGHMVAGLLAPGLSTPGATYPAELAAEITAEVGSYRIAPRGIYTPGAERALMRELHTCLELRGRLARYLLQNHRCDVHVFVLYETDVAQHKLWRFMDSSHPRYDSSAAEEWGSAIREVYAHADSIVGDLMSFAGDDDTVVVVSDHGGGPLHGTVHLNSWLRQERYLVGKEGWRQWLAGLNAKLNFVQVCARKLAHLGLLRNVRLGQKARRLVASGFLRAENIDWRQTTAYNMGFEGAVYMVGERRSAVAKEIAEGIRGLREPGSGEPLVGTIHKAEELYEGRLVEYAPDLILGLMGAKYSVSQKMFAPELVSEGSDSGTHSQTGILGLWGAGATADTRGCLNIEAVAELLLEVARGNRG